MTSHRNHDHDNTPAARAACRKQAAEWEAAFTFTPAPVVTPKGDPVVRPNFVEIAPNRWQEQGTITHYLVTIHATHCQQCGRVEGEEMGSWEGYTSCCNERAVSPWGEKCDPDECTHYEPRA